MPYEFSGEVWYWRGPAPFYFVTVPEDVSVELQAASSFVSYGWGMIPVTVEVGGAAGRRPCGPRTICTSSRSRSPSGAPRTSRTATWSTSGSLSAPPPPPDLW